MAFLRVFALERPRFEPCHLPAYSPSLGAGPGPAGDEAPCLGFLEALDADAFSGAIRGYHPLGFSPLLYPKSAEITKAPAPGQTETPFLLGAEAELLILISNRSSRDYAGATLSVAVSGAGELLAQLTRSFSQVHPRFQTSVKLTVPFTSPKLGPGDQVSLQVVLEMPGEGGSSGVLEEIKRKIPLRSPILVERQADGRSGPTTVTSLAGNSLTVSIPAPDVQEGSAPGASKSFGDTRAEAEIPPVHLLSEGDSYATDFPAHRLVMTHRMGAILHVPSASTRSSALLAKWRVHSRDTMKKVSVASPFVYSVDITATEPQEGENGVRKLCIVSAAPDSPDLVALDCFPLQVAVGGDKATVELTLMATKPGIHALSSLALSDDGTQTSLADAVIVCAE